MFKSISGKVGVQLVSRFVGGSYCKRGVLYVKEMGNFQGYTFEEGVYNSEGGGTFCEEGAYNSEGGGIYFL